MVWARCHWTGRVPPLGWCCPSMDKLWSSQSCDMWGHVSVREWEDDMNVTCLWKTWWYWGCREWVECFCSCNMISWSHKGGVTCIVTGDLWMLKVETAHETGNSQAGHRALWVRALPQLLFHPKMKGRKFKSDTNTNIRTCVLMACV